MADHKSGLRPVPHVCPVCQFPQTKIQRKLGEDTHGSITYVCARVECSVGIDLSRVETWSVV